MEWLLEHGEDAEIDVPLTEEQVILRGLGFRAKARVWDLGFEGPGEDC